jgi:hypothetical protein
MDAGNVIDNATGTLLANAIAILAGRVMIAAESLKGKLRREDMQVAANLNSYAVTSRAEPTLPSLAGVSDDTLLEVIQSNEMQAIVHELLALRLLEGPESEAIRLDEAVLHIIADEFPEIDRKELEVFAAALFDRLDGHCRELADRVAEGSPEFLERVRQGAHYALVTATLRAAERHLAALAETSVTSRRQETDFLRQYKSQLRAAHGFIIPPDFDRRRKIPINNLYVSPDISHSVGSPRSLTVLALAECTDRTVLLGDPGGGKSTASQWIIHHYATEKTAKVVPLLVVLRDFARDDREPERSILQYIEDRLNGHYQCRPPRGFVERLLLEGSALVVFDGLDELVDTTRRSEVTEKVELFCNRYPLSRVLVTSRRIGYDQAPMDRAQFRSFEIAGFSVRQVEGYVHRWFAQDEDVGEAGARKWAHTFMRESEDVPELRSNPLMLALMCILYRGQGWIPKKSARCIRALRYNAVREVGCKPKDSCRTESRSSSRAHPSTLGLLDVLQA